MKYLFEIYTEEIPATFLNGAVNNMKNLAEKKLSEYKINYQKIETFGTPRRLVLFIDGLDKKEADDTVEVKGPPVKVALNEDGTPTNVYNKFLESNNIPKENVFVKSTKKGDYIFGKKIVKGRETYDIVKELSLYLLTNLHFPKSMHWEESGVRFVRPIRYILALLDSKVVKFEFAGVKSGQKTFGLRIDKPKEIEVKNPLEYFVKLKENYVILPYVERKNIVERKARNEAQKINGVPVYSKSHLEEVVNLTEYPTPFLASIGQEASTIPQCIVRSIIEGHMKSFAITDGKGHLLPYFIGVRNGSSDFIDIVKSGYEKVVKARVLDGKFFFEEDKKVKLENLVEKLSGIVFIKGLGTLKEKTDRIVKLATQISELLHLEQTQKMHLERAAFLSKADLLTNVVKEFPELQGTMGGIYAELQGEEKAVAIAISEQYLPRFSGDKIPDSLIGKYLSLLDKVDTLVGTFGIGINTSGSKDPFGLRRAGSGIMQIVSSFDTTEFPIYEILEKSVSTYIESGIKINNKVNDIVSFLKEREKAILKEMGIRYDVVNAILSLPINLAPTYAERAKTLMQFINESTLQYIVLSNKRVSNILQKAGEDSLEINPGLFREHEEENLYEMILKTKRDIQEKLKKRDYATIMTNYFSLYDAIAQFFDNVLVMAEDKEIRKNRLALLKEMQKLFSEFADFSEIVIEKKV